MLTCLYNSCVSEQFVTPPPPLDMVCPCAMLSYTLMMIGMEGGAEGGTYNYSTKLGGCQRKNYHKKDAI